MASKYRTKKLIVEGSQDKRVIPELIEASGIDWGESANNAVVYIEDYGSDGFIETDFISTELKASGLIALGLVVDADDDLDARWGSVRNACLKSIPDIPAKLPEVGLIHITSTGVRFGVWIMPDNKTQGMLETFLRYLIPTTSEPLWEYAKEISQEASTKGAPYIKAHYDKACIYTWLAWQNPPGRQLHNAITERILDPSHEKARDFVNWFRQLYDL